MTTPAAHTNDSRAHQPIGAARGVSLDDLILNYDPESPQQRFTSANLEVASSTVSERLPSAVAWPHAPPTAAAPNPAPAATDDLSRFAGFDAVVVTWTAAEAVALATLFTPDYPLSAWYEYRHNVASYEPLVTGSQAPFNDTRPEQARYYRSLGLYFPCRIGDARVLLFKSGLHLDYDGPACPVKKLMAKLAQTVRPKVFITTGTGGAIGPSVALGDVLIAVETRFDCTTQFEHEPWAKATYATSPVPAGAVAAITPHLLAANASRLPNTPVPKIMHGTGAIQVTTDFFGFDDSTDYYHLQGLGRVCDMGDAMVGQALQQFAEIKWYSVRNASDPQISNPKGDIATAKQTAGDIYMKYGAITTAGSLIATWALIDRSINMKTATARSTRTP